MDEEQSVEKENKPISLGMKFVTLREKSGLTQHDIATKIRVRQTIIETIESDKILNVPAVFLKGYIKAYADIVGLPKEEYQPYLDMRMSQPPTTEMKNYSHKEQNKRKGKRLFFISFLLLLIIIGVALFFIWKDDRTNLVEVNHYVSPPNTSRNS